MSVTAHEAIPTDAAIVRKDFTIEAPVEFVWSALRGADVRHIGVGQSALARRPARRRRTRNLSGRGSFARER